MYLRRNERLQVDAAARTRRRPIVHAALLSTVLIATICSFFASKGIGGVPITGLALPNIGVSRPAQPAVASGVLTNTVRRSDMEQALQAYSGQVGPTAPNGSAGGSQAQAVSSPVLRYQLYTVAEGDTASAISSRFGINLQYLLAANSDLRDGEFLAVGQQLIVPPGNGILHNVGYGETLTEIADRFGVTIQDVLSWPDNHLASADQLVEGQLVFLPDGTLPAAVSPEPTDAPALVVAPATVPAPGAANGPTSSSGLIWPVTGPISSYMGPDHPLGIDIDLYATPFTTISAATSGTVTFAGGDPCCSYGYYVIIMSPDGIETLYAHFSQLGVSSGQTVNQGDSLGISGCTGYCTGNHLHFEVIDNGTRVNPLSYLP